MECHRVVAASSPNSIRSILSKTRSATRSTTYSWAGKLSKTCHRLVGNVL